MNQMMGQFSTPLKGRTVLLMVILTNAVYLVMMLWSIPQVLAYSEGLSILDMRPLGYSMGEVTELFAHLGMEGRSSYLYTQIPLDMIYPFLFGLSYYLLITWVLTKLHLLDTKWSYFVYLPFVAALFDYLENVGIVFLLYTFPDFTESEVRAVSVVSILKSSATTLFFIGLILFFIKWAIKKGFGKS